MSTKIDVVNHTIGARRFKNNSLVDKVETLEAELSHARSQLERISSSKFDEMLSVQKSNSAKARLGYDGSNSSTPIAYKPNGPRGDLFNNLSRPKPKVKYLRLVRADLFLEVLPRLILILVPRRTLSLRDLIYATTVLQLDTPVPITSNGLLAKRRMVCQTIDFGLRHKTRCLCLVS